MKIISVVGARPNFIKIAPVHRAFQKYDVKISHKICHTGQHFDGNMSKVFFDDLGLAEPDYYLGVGSGSHAEQTARILTEFEKVLLNEKPNLILVPGDVNSTLACSLVAAKMGIPIGHIEAGLRSFDRTMPEEINRVVTDVLSNYLFVTEPSGLINLEKEGFEDSKVFFVGNVMIDSLVHLMHRIEKSTVLSTLNLSPGEYILATFHRPNNVDDPKQLTQLVKTMAELSAVKPVIFPVHPRTRKNLENNRLLKDIPGSLLLLDPVGYIDFLSLEKNAALVITDSGGIQEETTYLGVQCITARDNTERPVTVDIGTNHLIGTDFNKVKEAAISVLNGNIKKGKTPELWDGKAAERIVQIIMDKLG